MNLDIFCKLFNNSLTNSYTIQKLCICFYSHSTQTLKLHCNGYQMSSHNFLTLFFKKLFTKFFQQIRPFIHLIQKFFEKFMTQLEDWHMFLYKHCPKNAYGYSYQMSHHTLFNSSSSKKLLTKIFHEILQFLHLIQQYFEMSHTSRAICSSVYTNSKNTL